MTMWMVRAGQGATEFERFRELSIVSINSHAMGPLHHLQTRDEFLTHVSQRCRSNARLSNIRVASFLYRFVRGVRIADQVITYSLIKRCYLVGTVAGAYEYVDDPVADQPNVRKVIWRGLVSRDELSARTRDSLGAICTLFTVPPSSAVEIERVLNLGSQRGSAC